MPLRPARVGRVGVIGHPVAKTAVVAKAVTPGPSPVAKTAVVAAAVTPGQVSAGRDPRAPSTVPSHSSRRSWIAGPVVRPLRDPVDHGHRPSLKGPSTQR